MKSLKTILIGLASVAIGATAAQAEGVLDRVKARGELRCGVGDPTPGWHSLDNQNRWVGFGVDYCRAIAAAVLGDAEKIAINPIGWAQSYEALRSGEVDVVTTSHTYKIERDTGMQVNFPTAYFFTGITVMTRKEHDVQSFEDLADATICILSGSSMEATVSEWFRAKNLPVKLVPFDTITANSEAYSKGRCDAFATEPPLLAGFRQGYDNPDDHVILNDLFSIDALGPMVAEGDEQWNNIVRSVIFATIAADQHRITAANAEELAKSSDNASIRRLLGTEGELGKFMGLPADWGFKIITQVGPYSAIYDRNLGKDSASKLEPGFNRYVSDGGLLYAPGF
jgi:ABC-type amino acid transport/signal transduction systems, periplasmic component/domain